MNYQIKASSQSKEDAVIHIKKSNINFGTTLKNADTLPNPAELFLGSFAACMLKNVERFSLETISNQYIALYKSIIN